MKLPRNITVIAMVCCCGLSVTAQTRSIDSLKKNIRLAGGVKEKIASIFSLCELGYILHPDTLMQYAEQARQLAVAAGNSQQKIQALYYQSGALSTKGLIDSSLERALYCLRVLEEKKLSDPVLEANLYNQQGRCFMRKNRYKDAIDMGYRTISTAEAAGDVLLQIKGKTLIGWAFLEMGQTADALQWHLQAMRTTADTLLLEKYGILFANLALNYNGLGKTDSAFFYIGKAIRSSRKHENLFALSNSLAIQSQLLVRAGRVKEAEAPLKEMVEIRKLIGDPFYIVSDMSQLGLYYANNGQPEKGIAICREGIAMARQYQIDTKLLFLYSSLAENYKAAGDVSRYAETLETIIGLKDSVYQKNSAQALAEVQTRYETEKNENIIARQELALVKKNYWLYGSLFLLLAGSVIFYLVFSNYRRKQKLRNEFLLKEEKFARTQAIAKAEENERKRIAADLHDNLGAYAAAIASNADQAGRETGREQALRELKNNAQSIVSQLNDTIWVLKKDNLTLTAISDRIKAFMQRIGASYPEISFDVTENLQQDFQLPAGNAFHLYQVIQEAVSNALKHSGARSIRVLLESGDNWKICIADDGNGFDPAVPGNGSGNGIPNMKNRCAEAGWQVSWLTRDGGGTKVLIHPTTN